MADREKVIKGLVCCTNGNLCSGNCPYDDEYDDVDDCRSELAKDALETIEEQQAEIERLKAKETPMEPNDIRKHMYDMWMGWCSSCGNIVFNLHVYCPHCGQKQDWSDVK